ncbi:hypothetical protein VOLCADRAFT_88618 [Volvox carteri f. nagariensis]|uniref:Uncharacterized protein n=1 Tax=Volvox carteri f. nagariensis TaxID=3068 RepID=D8TPH3_VOLCA|nr:uncharacterized protein VOLCADRAFT_88618 [Volvox carteri f. nagariensis]EFJ50764.1 hypothetical protein VOLCADRAFT_88618 [Volvox carteri f. nagariensis]|eukprot:XP_002948357.1 hypothetical protein VOLCADRAFT_88618 [Volvox carteri f. nagariensis]
MPTAAVCRDLSACQAQAALAVCAGLSAPLVSLAPAYAPVHATTSPSDPSLGVFSHLHGDAASGTGLDQLSAAQDILSSPALLPEWHAATATTAAHASPSSNSKRNAQRAIPKGNGSSTSQSISTSASASLNRISEVALSVLVMAELVQMLSGSARQASGATGYMPRGGAEAVLGLGLRRPASPGDYTAALATSPRGRSPAMLTAEELHQALASFDITLEDVRRAESVGAISPELLRGFSLRPTSSTPSPNPADSPRSPDARTSRPSPELGSLYSTPEAPAPGPVESLVRASVSTSSTLDPVTARPAADTATSLEAGKGDVWERLDLGRPAPQAAQPPPQQPEWPYTPGQGPWARVTGALEDAAEVAAIAAGALGTHTRRALDGVLYGAFARPTPRAALTDGGGGEGFSGSGAGGNSNGNGSGGGAGNGGHGGGSSGSSGGGGNKGSNGGDGSGGGAGWWWNPHLAHVLRMLAATCLLLPPDGQLRLFSNLCTSLERVGGDRGATDAALEAGAPRAGRMERRRSRGLRASLRPLLRRRLKAVQTNYTAAGHAQSAEPLFFQQDVLEQPSMDRVARSGCLLLQSPKVILDNSSSSSNDDPSAPAWPCVPDGLLKQLPQATVPELTPSNALLVRPQQLPGQVATEHDAWQQGQQGAEPHAGSSGAGDSKHSAPAAVELFAGVVAASLDLWTPATGVATAGSCAMAMAESARATNQADVAFPRVATEEETVATDSLLRESPGGAGATWTQPTSSWTDATTDTIPSRSSAAADDPKGADNGALWMAAYPLKPRLLPQLQPQATPWHPCADPLQAAAGPQVEEPQSQATAFPGHDNPRLRPDAAMDGEDSTRDEVPSPFRGCKPRPLVFHPRHHGSSRRNAMAATGATRSEGGERPISLRRLPAQEQSLARAAPRPPTVTCGGATPEVAQSSSFLATASSAWQFRPSRSTSSSSATSQRTQHSQLCQEQEHAQLRQHQQQQLGRSTQQGVWGDGQLSGESSMLTLVLDSRRSTCESFDLPAGTVGAMSLLLSQCQVAAGVPPPGFTVPLSPVAAFPVVDTAAPAAAASVPLAALACAAATATSTTPCALLCDCGDNTEIPDKSAVGYGAAVSLRATVLPLADSSQDGLKLAEPAEVEAAAKPHPDLKRRRHERPPVLSPCRHDICRDQVLSPHASSSGGAAAAVAPAAAPGPCGAITSTLAKTPATAKTGDSARAIAVAGYVPSRLAAAVATGITAPAGVDGGSFSYGIVRDNGHDGGASAASSRQSPSSDLPADELHLPDVLDLAELYRRSTRGGALLGPPPSTCTITGATVLAGAADAFVALEAQAWEASAHASAAAAGVADGNVAPACPHIAGVVSPVALRVPVAGAAATACPVRSECPDVATCLGVFTSPAVTAGGVWPVSRTSMDAASAVNPTSLAPARLTDPARGSPTSPAPASPISPVRACITSQAPDSPTSPSTAYLPPGNLGEVSPVSTANTHFEVAATVATTNKTDAAAAEAPNCVMAVDMDNLPEAHIPDPGDPFPCPLTEAGVSQAGPMAAVVCTPLEDSFTSGLSLISHTIKSHAEECEPAADSALALAAALAAHSPPGPTDASFLSMQRSPASGTGPAGSDGMAQDPGNDEIQSGGGGVEPSQLQLQQATEDSLDGLPGVTDSSPLPSPLHCQSTTVICRDLWASPFHCDVTVTTSQPQGPRAHGIDGAGDGQRSAVRVAHSVGDPSPEPLLGSYRSVPQPADPGTIPEPDVGSARQPADMESQSAAAASKDGALEEAMSGLPVMEASSAGSSSSNLAQPNTAVIVQMPEGAAMSRVAVHIPCAAVHPPSEASWIEAKDVPSLGRPCDATTASALQLVDAEEPAATHRRGTWPSYVPTTASFTAGSLCAAEATEAGATVASTFTAGIAAMAVAERPASTAVWGHGVLTRAWSCDVDAGPAPLGLGGRGLSTRRRPLQHFSSLQGLQTSSCLRRGGSSSVSGQALGSEAPQLQLRQHHPSSPAACDALDEVLSQLPRLGMAFEPGSGQAATVAVEPAAVGPRAVGKGGPWSPTRVAAAGTLATVPALAATIWARLASPAASAAGGISTAVPGSAAASVSSAVARRATLGGGSTPGGGEAQGIWLRTGTALTATAAVALVVLPIAVTAFFSSGHSAAPASPPRPPPPPTDSATAMILLSHPHHVSSSESDPNTDGDVDGDIFSGDVALSPQAHAESAIRMPQRVSQVLAAASAMAAGARGAAWRHLRTAHRNLWSDPGDCPTLPASGRPSLQLLSRPPGSLTQFSLADLLHDQAPGESLLMERLGSPFAGEHHSQLRLEDDLATAAMMLVDYRPLHAVPAEGPAAAVTTPAADSSSNIDTDQSATRLLLQAEPHKFLHDADPGLQQLPVLLTCASPVDAAPLPSCEAAIPASVPAAFGAAVGMSGGAVAPMPHSCLSVDGSPAAVTLTAGSLPPLSERRGDGTDKHSVVGSAPEPEAEIDEGQPCSSGWLERMLKGAGIGQGQVPASADVTSIAGGGREVFSSSSSPSEVALRSLGVRMSRGTRSAGGAAPIGGSLTAAAAALSAASPTAMASGTPRKAMVAVAAPAPSTTGLAEVLHEPPSDILRLITSPRAAWSQECLAPAHAHSFSVEYARGSPPPSPAKRNGTVAAANDTTTAGPFTAINSAEIAVGSPLSPSVVDLEEPVVTSPEEWILPTRAVPGSDGCDDVAAAPSAGGLSIEFLHIQRGGYDADFLEPTPRLHVVPSLVSGVIACPPARQEAPPVSPRHLGDISDTLADGQEVTMESCGSERLQVTAEAAMSDCHPDATPVVLPVAVIGSAGFAPSAAPATVSDPFTAEILAGTQNDRSDHCPGDVGQPVELKLAQMDHDGDAAGGSSTLEQVAVLDSTPDADPAVPGVACSPSPEAAVPLGIISGPAKAAHVDAVAMIDVVPGDLAIPFGSSDVGDAVAAASMKSGSIVGAVQGAGIPDSVAAEAAAATREVLEEVEEAIEWVIETALGGVVEGAEVLDTLVVAADDPPANVVQCAASAATADMRDTSGAQDAAAALIKSTDDVLENETSAAATKESPTDAGTAAVAAAAAVDDETGATTAIAEARPDTSGSTTIRVISAVDADSHATSASAVTATPLAKSAAAAQAMTTAVTVQDNPLYLSPQSEPTSPQDDDGAAAAAAGTGAAPEAPSFAVRNELFEATRVKSPESTVPAETAATVQKVADVDVAAVTIGKMEPGCVEALAADADAGADRDRESSGDRDIARLSSDPAAAETAQVVPEGPVEHVAPLVTCSPSKMTPYASLKAEAVDPTAPASAALTQAAAHKVHDQAPSPGIPGQTENGFGPSNRSSACGSGAPMEDAVHAQIENEAIVDGLGPGGPCTGQQAGIVEVPRIAAPARAAAGCTQASILLKSASVSSAALLATTAIACGVELGDTLSVPAAAEVLSAAKPEPAQTTGDTERPSGIAEGGWTTGPRAGAKLGPPGVLAAAQYNSVCASYAEPCRSSPHESEGPKAEGVCAEGPGSADVPAEGAQIARKSSAAATAPDAVGLTNRLSASADGTNSGSLCTSQPADADVDASLSCAPTAHEQALLALASTAAAAVQTPLLTNDADSGADADLHASGNLAVMDGRCTGEAKKYEALNEEENAVRRDTAGFDDADPDTDLDTNTVVDSGSDDDGELYVAESTPLRSLTDGSVLMVAAGSAPPDWAARAEVFLLLTPEQEARGDTQEGGGDWEHDAAGDGVATDTEDEGDEEEEDDMDDDEPGDDGGDGRSGLTTAQQGPAYVELPQKRCVESASWAQTAGLPDAFPTASVEGSNLQAENLARSDPSRHLGPQGSAATTAATTVAAVAAVAIQGIAATAAAAKPLSRIPKPPDNSGIASRTSRAHSHLPSAPTSLANPPSISRVLLFDFEASGQGQAATSNPATGPRSGGAVRRDSPYGFLPLSATRGQTSSRQHGPISSRVSFAGSTASSVASLGSGSTSSRLSAVSASAQSKAGRTGTFSSGASGSAAAGLGASTGIHTEASGAAARGTGLRPPIAPSIGRIAGAGSGVSSNGAAASSTISTTINDAVPVAGTTRAKALARNFEQRTTVVAAPPPLPPGRAMTSAAVAMRSRAGSAAAAVLTASQSAPAGNKAVSMPSPEAQAQTGKTATLRTPMLWPGSAPIQAKQGPAPSSGPQPAAPAASAMSATPAAAAATASKQGPGASAGVRMSAVSPVFRRVMRNSNTGEDSGSGDEGFGSPHLPPPPHSAREGTSASAFGAGRLMRGTSRASATHVPARGEAENHSTAAASVSAPPSVRTSWTAALRNAAPPSPLSVVKPASEAAAVPTGKSAASVRVPETAAPEAADLAPADASAHEAELEAASPESDTQSGSVEQLGSARSSRGCPPCYRPAAHFVPRTVACTAAAAGAAAAGAAAAAVPALQYQPSAATKRNPDGVVARVAAELERRVSERHLPSLPPSSLPRDSLNSPLSSIGSGGDSSQVTAAAGTPLHSSQSRRVQDLIRSHDVAAAASSGPQPRLSRVSFYADTVTGGASDESPPECTTSTPGRCDSTVDSEEAARLQSPASASAAAGGPEQQPGKQLPQKQLQSRPRHWTLSEEEEEEGSPSTLPPVMQPMAGTPWASPPQCPQLPCAETPESLPDSLREHRGDPQAPSPLVGFEAAESPLPQPRPVTVISEPSAEVPVASSCSGAPLPTAQEAAGQHQGGKEVGKDAVAQQLQPPPTSSRALVEMDGAPQAGQHEAALPAPVRERPGQVGQPAGLEHKSADGGADTAGSKPDAVEREGDLVLELRSEEVAAVTVVGDEALAGMAHSVCPADEKGSEPTLAQPGIGEEEEQSEASSSIGGADWDQLSEGQEEEEEDEEVEELGAAEDVDVLGRGEIGEGAGDGGSGGGGKNAVASNASCGRRGGSVGSATAAVADEAAGASSASRGLCEGTCGEIAGLLGANEDDNAGVEDGGAAVNDDDEAGDDDDDGDYSDDDDGDDEDVDVAALSEALSRGRLGQARTSQSLHGIDFTAVTAAAGAVARQLSSLGADCPSAGQPRAGTAGLTGSRGSTTAAFTRYREISSARAAATATAARAAVSGTVEALPPSSSKLKGLSKAIRTLLKGGKKGKKDKQRQHGGASSVGDGASSAYSCYDGASTFTGISEALSALEGLAALDGFSIAATSDTGVSHGSVATAPPGGGGNAASLERRRRKSLWKRMKRKLGKLMGLIPRSWEAAERHQAAAVALEAALVEARSLTAFVGRNAARAAHDREETALHVRSYYPAEGSKPENVLITEMCNALGGILARSCRPDQLFLWLEPHDMDVHVRGMAALGLFTALSVESVTQLAVQHFDLAAPAAAAAVAAAAPRLAALRLAGCAHLDSLPSVITSTHVTLRRLSLEGCGTWPEQLGKALAACADLEHLTVMLLPNGGGDGSGDAAAVPPMIPVCEALTRLTQLRSLCLELRLPAFEANADGSYDFVPYGESTVAAAAALARGFTALTRLSRLEVGDGGTQPHPSWRLELLHNLAGLPRLEELTWRRLECDPEATFALASSSSLTSLSVEKFRTVAPLAAVALAAAACATAEVQAEMATPAATATAAASAKPGELPSPRELAAAAVAAVAAAASAAEAGPPRVGRRAGPANTSQQQQQQLKLLLLPLPPRLCNLRVRYSGLSGMSLAALAALQLPPSLTSLELRNPKLEIGDGDVDQPAAARLLPEAALALGMGLTKLAVHCPDLQVLRIINETRQRNALAGPVGWAEAAGGGGGPAGGGHAPWLSNLGRLRQLRRLNLCGLKLGRIDAEALARHATALEVPIEFMTLRCLRRLGGPGTGMPTPAQYDQSALGVSLRWLHDEGSPGDCWREANAPGVAVFACSESLRRLLGSPQFLSQAAESQSRHSSS